MTTRLGVEDRIEDRGEFIVNVLYGIPSARNGFGGCTVVVRRSGHGGLRMTLKLGTDNSQGLKNFNSTDILDDIVNSEIEEEISLLRSDIDLDAHDFMFKALIGD